MTTLPSPAPARELTDAEVEALKARRRDDLVKEIDAISRTLKGYGFSFAERLLLNELRHDLRAELRALDGAEGRT